MYVKGVIISGDKQRKTSSTCFLKLKVELSRKIWKQREKKSFKMALEYLEIAEGGLKCLK